MTALNILVQSFVIGLAIAAPVGPVGVLCIHRTLVYGMLHGFISGMGAATADALYGCIIAFGLTALSGFLLAISDPLSIAGGLFLLYLGIRTLHSATKPDFSAQPAGVYSSLFSNYVTTLALTVTNPLTILAFIGVFAGIGSDGTLDNSANNWLIVAGIFMGSAAWWLALSAGVGLLRAKVTPQLLLWVNRFSGLIIILFALRILLSLLT